MRTMSLEPRALRVAMTALLAGTGLVHLALAATGEGPTRIPVGIFGAIYLGVGLWMRPAAGTTKAPVRAGAIACAVGFVLGTGSAIASGGTPLGWVLLAVDVAVVASGLFWFRTMQAA